MIRGAKKRAFLSAFMVAASCHGIASAAPLLYGYVNENAEVAPPISLHATAAGMHATGEPKIDLLSRFQGTWQAVTIVTDSMVPGVQTGQQVISTMEFAKADDGRVYAKWQQPGWREAQASISVISCDAFVIDRTSYCLGDQLNGRWATRSRDQYSLLDGNKVLSTSEIDQYLDGKYLGRYCTRSVLVKISDSTSIAVRR